MNHCWKSLFLPLLCWLALCGHQVWAQVEAKIVLAELSLGLKEIAQAGGLIGGIIVALSIAMLALIVEHALSLRKNTLLPALLAEQTHKLIANRQVKQAEENCREQPGLLSNILAAGLSEMELGYAAVEKAMEDACLEQSACLHRKIEYLSVISTIAPMLGLLGTVWGMIQAFLEFETKANPQVSELAPGIYRALVTTLLGLGVAVPAVASYAFFRNRIDELVAEAARLSERVFADYKRLQLGRKQLVRQKRPSVPDEFATLDDPSPSATEREIP